MTSLRLSIRNMASADPDGDYAGAECRLTPKPGEQIAGADNLFTSQPYRFHLDANGDALVTVEANPGGTWYLLELRGGGQWELVVQGDTDTGHDAARRFDTTRPDRSAGAVIIEGPPGPTGPPGPDGPAGPRGIFDIPIWQAAATKPAAPTDLGTYDLDSYRWTTLPTGWLGQPPTPTSSEKLWFVMAVIDPTIVGAANVVSYGSVGEDGTGAGGAPGPPGPAGGYAYYAHEELSLIPVTNETGTEASGTILNKEFEPGIFAGVPFTTFYEGTISLDVGSGGTYSVALQTTHTIGATTFTAERTVSMRLNAGTASAIPLTSYNSVSEVNAGSYVAPDGRTIQITEEMIASAVTIKIDVVVSRGDNKSFTLDSLSLMPMAAVTFWQQAFGTGTFARGPKGDKGDTGPKGDTGDTGPSGARGSVWAAGTTAPTDALFQTASGVAPQINDQWLRDNGQVYERLAQANSWQTRINLKGPKGDPGAKGEPGADGKGVPTGGTTEQVLAKKSATDFDTAWVDQTGGSGVPDGGTKGQVLTKKSATDGDADWLDIPNELLGGTRPPKPTDGKDGDWWVEGDIHDGLAVWENVSGNWVEIGDVEKVIINPTPAGTDTATGIQVGADKWVFDGGAPSQEEVFDQDKKIGKAGTGITITDDDAHFTRTYAADNQVTQKAVYDQDKAIDKAGTGITITDDDGASTRTYAADNQVTQKAVYDQDKEILKGGDGLTVTASDGDEELTLDVDTPVTTENIYVENKKILHAGDGISISNADLLRRQSISVDKPVNQESVYEANKLALLSDDTITETDDDTAHTTTLSVATPVSVANIFALLKDMIEGPSSRISITVDEDSHTITLTPLDEVLGPEWGDLVVGYSFRIGNIVRRNDFWFICIKAHQKGGTGPDNDSTNWEALTLWTGAYDGKRWYHSGMIAVNSDGLLCVSRIDNSPNTTEPSETTAEWVVVGGARNSGGGSGHWDSFIDGTAPNTGTDYTITGLETNDIIDLVLITTAASSGTGTVTLTADSTLERIDDDTAALSLTVANGAKSRTTGQYRYLGSSGEAVVEYSFTGDSPAETTAAAIVPEHATAFVPTPDNIYPVNSLIFKGGNNVDLVFDDTDRTIVTNVKLPDYAAPRLYAIDSRDKRRVQPPYSYYQTFTGFSLQPGQEHRIQGEPAIHDYDRSRPGFAIDTLNGQHNSNGVDFSHATAGTTVRRIDVSAEITLANERTYGSEESLLMKVYAYGYAKTKAVADGQIIFTKRFHFHGGFQDAFTYDFPIIFSQAPRIGEHDGYRVTFEWFTGTTEVVRGIVDAYKETFTLSALGSIPKQSFTHHTARHVDTLDDWIPTDLKKEVTSASRILTWGIGSPDETGTNAPNESDKADVLAPDVTFGTTDSKAKDKPFIRAAQDLSRVKLHFAGSGQQGAGDVYLCSRIQGFPAGVLANTAASTGWTLDFTNEGALSQQDFYLLDIKGGGVGSPTATWDANPGGPKINNVIDGIFHTAALVAGINFTPFRTSEFSLDDAELIEAAQAGLLHVLRVDSNKVIGEMPLRGVPRPVPYGSGSDARIQCGPTWLRGSENGSATEVVWADTYEDIHGLHFAIKGSGGGADTIWVSGAEIEYARYTDGPPSSHKKAYLARKRAGRYELAAAMHEGAPARGRQFC